MLRRAHGRGRPARRRAALQEHGYTEVANLNGGIHDWDDAGLPTRVGDLWTGQCACQLRPRKK